MKEPLSKHLSIAAGQIVKGKCNEISTKEVLVDIGYKK
jgi:ribosomal protein S1